MSGAHNVLRVNAVEEQEKYLTAVAEILRNVQHAHKISLLQISEAIGVSLGTISNAANEKAALNAVFLNRIGRHYGAHHLDPYARLAGGRVVAHDASNAGEDILPTLLSTGTLVAFARSPSSPGGPRESLRERLNYLPELCRLRRELDALIATIENEREAA